MKAILKNINAKVNKIIVVLALWCVLLGYCAFVSTNVYLNAFLLFVGFISVVLAVAFVFDKGLNTKEEKFLSKGCKLLGME